MESEPLIIAHRGASGYVPGNTIQAFKLAVALGADYVECDVRFTKDEHIVIAHDPIISFGENGTVYDIKSLSFKDIRTLSGQDGNRIPTLEEAIDAIGNGCFLKVDIKDSSVGMGNRVLDVIQGYGLEDSAIITSRSPLVLKEVRSLSSYIQTEMGGFPNGKLLKKALQDACDFRVNIFSPHYSVADEKVIEAVHQEGLAVHVWTVNDREEIEVMKSRGVEGITTDFPGDARG